MGKSTQLSVPKPPDPQGPDYSPPSGWEHYQLWQRVRDSLTGLPVHFRTEINLPGIPATDLHTLNTAIGAAIEEQVVRMLNLLRTTWDPLGAYPTYSFVRQPQTFPDVRLTTPSGSHTILGFDLKGWYVLAKEGEPSLRFKTTRDACAPADCVVIVPWVLSNVLSGSPMLFEPYIVGAKFAADFRTHYWQYGRGPGVNTQITPPQNAVPYPKDKATKVNDEPAKDSTKNFGRLARVGLADLDTHIDKLNDFQLCGIRIDHWRTFFAIFKEGVTGAAATTALNKLRAKIQASTAIPSSQADSVLRILNELESLLKAEFPGV